MQNKINITLSGQFQNAIETSGKERHKIDTVILITRKYMIARNAGLIQALH